MRSHLCKCQESTYQNGIWFLNEACEHNCCKYKLITYFCFNFSFQIAMTVIHMQTLGFIGALKTVLCSWSAIVIKNNVVKEFRNFRCYSSFLFSLIYQTTPLLIYLTLKGRRFENWPLSFCSFMLSMVLSIPSFSLGIHNMSFLWYSEKVCKLEVEHLSVS